MQRERPPAFRWARWALGAGLAMIAGSFVGIMLTGWVGYGGTGAAIVFGALWLSILSGMVVACLAAGAMVVLRQGARRRQDVQPPR
jgi:hypothetical protein